MALMLVRKKLTASDGWTKFAENLLKKSVTLSVFEILAFINHWPEMLDASQTFSAHFRQISGEEIKNILKVCVYRFVWSQDGFLSFCCWMENRLHILWIFHFHCQNDLES